jgi:hypothetical protein
MPSLCRSSLNTKLGFIALVATTAVLFATEWMALQNSQLQGHGFASTLSTSMSFQQVTLDHTNTNTNTTSLSSLSQLHQQNHHLLQNITETTDHQMTETTTEHAKRTEHNTNGSKPVSPLALEAHRNTISHKNLAEYDGLPSPSQQ